MYSDIDPKYHKKELSYCIDPEPFDVLEKLSSVPRPMVNELPDALNRLLEHETSTPQPVGFFHYYYPLIIYSPLHFILTVVAVSLEQPNAP